MRSRLWLAGLAALSTGLLLTPCEAWAQTVTMDQATITRSTPLRPASLNPYWVSRADCDTGDAYTFPVQLSGFPADGSVVLQVWAGLAGVDCTVASNRSTATQQCWKVAVDYNASTSSTPSIEVPVRALVSADVTAQNVNKGDASTCSQAASSGPFAASTAQTVTLFFLPVQAINTVGTGYQYPIKVDLNGPAAPASVAAESGDGSLTVSWTEVTAGDVVSYNVYCDPSAGSEGASAVCASTNLNAGQVLADPAKYLCGTVTGLASTEGQATGLENLTRYAVAVAAVDAVGNVGPLSNLDCGTPRPRSDEGVGGGACQAAGPLTATGGGVGAIGVLGVALVGGRVRRRRTSPCR